MTGVQTCALPIWKLMDIKEKISKEEKKKGTEKIFEEIIVENIPNMGKEIDNQIQEVQRVPYRINPRRNNKDTY